MTAAGRLRVGIAGLGQAGRAMVAPLLRHPRCVIAGAADRRAELAAAFANDHWVPVFDDVAPLAESEKVDLVYIATPTHLRRRHVLAALTARRHVIVEKPMALNLADADEMIATAAANRVQLIVGHSQSFEPPIQAMASIVRSGELGPLGMLHTWCYSDWLYRPRAPEELDTSLGGGVVFRQAAHQVDLLRWIGGGMVRSVRAGVTRWDTARPIEGSHAAFLEFEDGAFATIAYSGYDHLPGHELTFGIGEDGRPAAHSPGQARARLATSDEAMLKQELAYRATDDPRSESPMPGFYGLTLVSCERCDIRQVPGGLRIYAATGTRDVPVAALPTGRDNLLDEAAGAVLDGANPAHDGAWGLANLEVCLAILQSASERREAILARQFSISR